MFHKYRILFASLLLFVLFFQMNAAIAAGPNEPAPNPRGSSLASVMSQLVSSLIKVLTEAVAAISEQLSKIQQVAGQKDDQPAKPDKIPFDDNSPAAAVTDGGQAEPAPVAPADSGAVDETPDVGKGPEEAIDEDVNEAIEVENENEEFQEKLEALKNQVVEFTEGSAERYSENLPDPNANYSAQNMVDAEAIVKNLRGLLDHISVDRPKKSQWLGKKTTGIQAFSMVYKISFDDFAMRLSTVYKHTYDSNLSWSQGYNMCHLDDSKNKLSRNSISYIDNCNTIFNKGVPEFIELLNKFMQKSIDDQVLCGYPDFYDEQMATVLHTAWNGDSSVWYTIKTVSNYRNNKKSLENRLKFWNSLSQDTSYFKKFLDKAGIKGVSGFKNLLNGVAYVITSFENRMKAEDQEAAKADGEENAKIEDDSEGSKGTGEGETSPEEGKGTGEASSDETKPENALDVTTEKPKEVRLRAADATNHVPSSYGETHKIRVRMIVLELIFTPHNLNLPKVVANRGDWREFDVDVTIAIKKEDNVTTIFYPTMVDSGRKDYEMIGDNTMIRENVKTSIALSDDGKNLIQEISDRNCRVTLSNGTRTIYNNTHVYDKSGKIKTIPIPGM
ncbi:MAG: hypothetical protein AB1403_02410 [Candidatus Riflebacteria bacterium]